MSGQAMDRIRRCDLNLAAYLRHAIGTAPGGEVFHRDGLLLFAGAHPNPGPYVNGILRLDASTSPEEVLEHGRRFFDPRNRSFVVWIRDSADSDLEELLRREGFWPRPPLAGQPGIFIDHPLEVPEIPGIELRRVHDRDGARDYLRVVADAWGLAAAPEELAWRMFLQPDAVLAPEVAAFVAYDGDEPRAGCMTYVSDGVAGMYWAGTTEAGRGRSLGAACWRATLRAGFEMGADMASAQSSARGTPVWLSMGFEIVTHYRRYVAAPAHRDPRA